MDRRKALFFIPVLGIGLPAAGRGPELKPPRPLPSNIDDEGARRLLAHSLDALCSDLAVLDGVIQKSGLPAEVAAMETGLSGMDLAKLSGMARIACEEPRGGLTPVDAANRARKLEWLLSLRLRALGEVAYLAVRPPVNRPTGPAGDFLRLHDLIVVRMREKTAPLLYGQPTMDHARELNDFWRQVILEHHWAEDRSLYPLVKETGDERVNKAADLLLAEHYHLAVLDREFEDAMTRATAGKISLSELARLVDLVRGEVELHFAKEAEAVIKPLTKWAPDVRLEAVMAEQERALRPFLAQAGWKRGNTAMGLVPDARP